MIESGKNRPKYLTFAIALALAMILLAAGCSGDKSGGTDPYGENTSAGDGSANETADNNSEATETEVGDKSATEEIKVMTQDEALKLISENIKVPLYKVSELGSEFIVEKQLPNKDNPEIITSDGEQAAQLTLTDKQGATVVLTFNIKGDLGDVETREVEVTGVPGVISQQTTDKGDLIMYNWTVGEGAEAIPYTLQLIGFSVQDAENLKNSLIAYQ